MIAGVILEICVLQHIPRSDHQRRTQLKRSTAGPFLAMAPSEAPEGRRPGARREHRPDPERIRSGNLGRGSLFVEQHRERNSLVLDEGPGITLATGADGGHARPGRQYLLVTIADLTGPLAAGQSAKVAEKQNHLCLVRPPVTKAFCDSVGIDEHLIGEGTNVETHAAILASRDAKPESMQAGGRGTWSNVFPAKHSVSWLLAYHPARRRELVCLTTNKGSRKTSPRSSF